jgi:hypothetical protein
MFFLLSFFLCFFFYKIGEKGWNEGEVAGGPSNVSNTHVSKCKSNKIKLKIKDG